MRIGRWLCIVNPVALHDLVEIGHAFLGFEDAAIAHDDPRRGGILLVAGHQNTRQAKRAGAAQRVLQDRNAVALSAHAGPNPVPDMTADLAQRRRQGVADV